MADSETSGGSSPPSNNFDVEQMCAACETVVGEILESEQEIKSSSNVKPIVIGLYGVPGCGKTYLLTQLKGELNPSEFTFYEGSKVISNIVRGGLDAFKVMSDKDKKYWRERAIRWIELKCIKTRTVGIVTGHFMFWTEGAPIPPSVLNAADLRTYTHIIYLDIDPSVVRQRTINDTGRVRTTIPVAHLKEWQQKEKSQLRTLCLENGVLFTRTTSGRLTELIDLLTDFAIHNRKLNTHRAKNKLATVFGSSLEAMELVLVMDADRTLSAEDTGKMFWEEVRDFDLHGGKDPLKELFSSPLSYSYNAFRQATLLYESLNEYQFDDICDKVAMGVKMYPEFRELLHKVREHENIGAIIVTCGLRVIWEEVLRREELSDVVKVIGNGLISDGFVVTPSVKAELGAQLRVKYKKYVIAFGDSPLDLDMLSRADEAIMVVGAESTRSKTMETELRSAIRSGALSNAYQVLLPETTTPRLDASELPLIKFTDDKFIQMVFGYDARHKGTKVISAGEKEAAKLLMAATRDARNSGPSLRDAHHNVGWYLATEYLGCVIGLEEHSIAHVQGTQASGHQLKDESKTTIVALMRGGEPMAFGVNDVFPLAMFVHAREPEDLKLHYLQGQKTVILVDSVVNSGTTIVNFVEHILKIYCNICIVVVTGVVQRECISKNGIVYNLAAQTDLTLITLRISDNKFIGQGTTDTGNRLFNTTELP